MTLVGLREIAPTVLKMGSCTMELGQFRRLLQVPAVVIE